jgi:hypothetical protein
VAGAALGAGAEPGPRFSLRAVSPTDGAPLPTSYFVFPSRAGASVAGAVLVTNSGDRPGTVFLYPVDGTTGRTSGVVYRQRRERRRDAGAWIRLGASSLALEPGESRIVSFQVLVPRRARPGDHVGGIVAENATLGGVGEGTVRIRVRSLTILAVLLQLPGPRPARLRAGPVRAGRIGRAPAAVIRLRNEGRSLLRPRGSLTVRDARGRRVVRVPLRLDTLLPSTVIDYPVSLPAKRKLSPGRDRFTLVLRYGGRQLRAVGIVGR